MTATHTLPTPYQQFIHLSRYSRWKDEEGRRETWEETVSRYINFFDEYTHGRFKDTLFGQVRGRILNLEVMPSMRAMMTAGEALKRENIAGFNPVVGSTLVVTREHGNIPIGDLEGKTASVLNVEGRWAPATFKGYGVQPLLRVGLNLNSSNNHFVDCTSNHRWILTDGTVKATSELSDGDRIPFVSATRPETDADYMLGVRHGLVYGDGTAVKAHKRVKGFMIRLCMDAEDLLPYFEGYPRSYPRSTNGDPVVYLYDNFAATTDLKALPDEGETDSYLLGFMRGWMAADGSVSKLGQISHCMSREGLDFVLKNSERIGFVVQRVYQQSAETNYGKRKTESHVVYYSRTSMVKDDFIIQRKRDRVSTLSSSWSVSSVESLGREDFVYCAEVPDTNTFTIAGGILTGNCSYVAINNKRSFSETLYILMCGTGVGFSCERQEVFNLPTVPSKLEVVEDVIVVGDSKEGWAKAFRKLISSLYSGEIPQVDYSRVRPAGARLKVFGGRASGPEPLKRLFVFCVEMFKKAAGRKLSSIEVHDIMCMIGEIVVVGGVRRSALISLSNLSDQRMRDAKSGQWWVENPQRGLANNSVAYTEKPEIEIFMEEWLSLIKSKSGERGIFNRVASQKQAARWGRRSPDLNYGVNPCSEIILRDKQFCRHCSF